MKSVLIGVTVLLVSGGLLLGQYGVAPAGQGLRGGTTGMHSGFGHGSLLDASIRPRGRSTLGRSRPSPWRPGRPLRPGRRRPVCPIPYYYGGYAYGAGEPERLHVSVQEIQAPQPSVLHNKDYNPGKPEPVVHNYGDGDLPEPAWDREPTRRPVASGAAPGAGSASTLYLIAYKNQTIYPAVKYWVEGDTLDYITPTGVHKRAKLDLIDTALSERLNRERNVRFVLPAR